MEVGDKYRILFPTEYGNFKGGDEVVVTSVMKFTATHITFYTIQNVKNKDHVATFKFTGFTNLVLLG